MTCGDAHLASVESKDEMATCAGLSRACLVYGWMAVRLERYGQWAGLKTVVSRSFRAAFSDACGGEQARRRLRLAA